MADVPSDIGELAQQEQSAEREQETPQGNYDWKKWALYAGIGIAVIAIAYFVYRAIANPANSSAPAASDTTSGGSGGSVQGDNGGTATGDGSTAGGTVDTSSLANAFSTFAQTQQQGLQQVAQADQAAIAAQGTQTQSAIAGLQSELTQESQTLAALSSQQAQVEQSANDQASAPSAPAIPTAPQDTKLASVTSLRPGPSQSVPVGSTVMPYDSQEKFTTSGPTITQQNPASGYQGSTTYSPTTQGGIYVHGINGTGFYAPPGSSVYNALVNGGS